MSRRTLACAVAVVAVLGTATACRPADTTGSGGTTSTATSPGDGKADGDRKTVPDVVGMGLQSAQDAAQAAGFHRLTSHDSLGRARMQILDRDWKVCAQNVEAGAVRATDTELDFGAVKLDETCPPHDQAAAPAAGTMPDFRGKSVKAARRALDSGTSIRVDDASGAHRFVLIESNWQVCTQNPVAGTKLTGRPVALTAVKYGESCP
ncbi:PASTA domain-containing protein [Streptomyces albidocamelliae]|uniref:PASTA domain-containing protein n=1 Tax=Streptomyces albidocamelliae TaxID=2981135 RepID=A0ABY6EIQ4_9ACTN|nr:PASTA domain-containing protein [Streptomyces sp. HUAS 14-6]UXY33851.1 PASTA domain-containing protein [Streptomyces sp. HUAS 14-6]